MRQALNPVMEKVLKRLHYPLHVILLCVRWYSAYPLSLRNLEEMMAERGISVDHSTVHRWAIKLLPILGNNFRRFKREVGSSWRMDETYIKVKGEWKYLCRAVDKAGDTVDFLLRAHRDKAAARRFFEQAIERNGEPEKVTIDKSGSNVAALEAINAGRGKRIVVRQVKYLNNIVEQDHRSIKRRSRPMLGFKDFRCARILLSGIELMHMIRKGKWKTAALDKPPRSFSTPWQHKLLDHIGRLVFKHPYRDRTTVSARTERSISDREWMRWCGEVPSRGRCGFKFLHMRHAYNQTFDLP